jgi:hypothetical protein
MVDVLFLKCVGRLLHARRDLGSGRRNSLVALAPLDGEDEATAERIGSTGATARFRHLDVAIESDVQRVFDEVAGTFGNSMPWSTTRASPEPANRRSAGDLGTADEEEPCRRRSAVDPCRPVSD